MPLCPLQLPGVQETTDSFGLAADLIAHKATAPTDFCYRPMIAMITQHEQAIKTHHAGRISLDGSIEGCDMVLPKPLNLDVVRTLAEGCGV